MKKQETTKKARAKARRKYEKPHVTSESLFETRAQSCQPGKTSGDLGDCQFSPSS